MTMCDEGEQGASAIHSTLLYALLTVTRYSSPKYLGTLSHYRLSYTSPYGHRPTSTCPSQTAVCGPTGLDTTLDIPRGVAHLTRLN